MAESAPRSENAKLNKHDAFLRSQRRQRRARVRAAPEPDVEQNPLPLVSQGARSPAAPRQHVSPDELLRSGREPIGGGGWRRLF